MTCIPVPDVYGWGKDCLILIPFRLPKISCFTLSLRCFFSDSDNCLHVGIGPPASVPPPTEGRSSHNNTPVFPLVPLPYWVLRSYLCSFPLVKYSCLLSVVVLHVLLCLKVYSSCIHEERCTPRPLTPPPSCSSPDTFFFKKRRMLKFQINFKNLPIKKC